MSVKLLHSVDQARAIRTAVDIAIWGREGAIKERHVTFWLNRDYTLNELREALEYLIAQKIPFLSNETVSVFNGLGGPVLKLSKQTQVLTAFALLGNAMAYSARYDKIGRWFDPFTAVRNIYCQEHPICYSSDRISELVGQHLQQRYAFAYTVLQRLRHNTAEASEFQWHDMGDGARAFGEAAYELIGRMIRWVTDAALFVDETQIFEEV